MSGRQPLSLLLRLSLLSLSLCDCGELTDPLAWFPSFSQAAIRASLGESEGPREGEGAVVTANPAYGGSPGDGGGDGGAQNDLEKALALSLEEFNQNKGGSGGE